MRSFREACASIWGHLNPSEPDAGFLAKVFASAILLFVIAAFIGHY